MLGLDLIVKTCAVPQLIRALPRRRVRRDQVTHRPIDRSDETGPARVDGEIWSAGKHALEPPTFNPREVAEELGDRVCIGVRTPAALIVGQIRCQTNHLKSLKGEHQLQHVGFGTSLHSPNIATPTRPVKPITPPKRARRVDHPAFWGGPLACSVEVLVVELQGEVGWVLADSVGCGFSRCAVTRSRRREIRGHGRPLAFAIAS